jgi:hypothetical protein
MQYRAVDGQGPTPEQRTRHVLDGLINTHRSACILSDALNRVGYV